MTAIQRQGELKFKTWVGIPFLTPAEDKALIETFTHRYDSRGPIWDQFESFSLVKAVSDATKTPRTLKISAQDILDRLFDLGLTHSNLVVQKDSSHQVIACQPYQDVLAPLCSAAGRTPLQLESSIKSVSQCALHLLILSRVSRALISRPLFQSSNRM